MTTEVAGSLATTKAAGTVHTHVGRNARVTSPPAPLSRPPAPLLQAAHPPQAEPVEPSALAQRLAPLFGGRTLAERDMRQPAAYPSRPWPLDLPEVARDLPPALDPVTSGSTLVPASSAADVTMTDAELSSPATHDRPDRFAASLGADTLDLVVDLTGLQIPHTTSRTELDLPRAMA